MVKRVFDFKRPSVLHKIQKPKIRKKRGYLSQNVVHFFKCLPQKDSLGFARAVH